MVQYAFTFLADLVMQNPSMMIGGIAAGSVPPNDVVTDPDGPVFPVNPGTTGPFSGSVFLNLSTGRFTASWTIQQTTSSITGYVRCAEDAGPPPGDRFMFVIPQDDAGFFVLTTTSI